MPLKRFPTVFTLAKTVRLKRFTCKQIDPAAHWVDPFSNTRVHDPVMALCQCVQTNFSQFDDVRNSVKGQSANDYDVKDRHIIGQYFDSSALCMPNYYSKKVKNSNRGSNRPVWKRLIIIMNSLLTQTTENFIKFPLKFEMSREKKFAAWRKIKISIRKTGKVQTHVTREHAPE